MMKKILAGFAVAAFAVSASGASAATYNFTRDLTVGSTGADVVALQDVLISNGYLVIPAGTSKGYFGGLTQAAVAKWQASAGIAPAAGYFGPISRAALSKVDTGSNTGGDTDSNSGKLQGGDGDFRSFKILGTPSNEDVEEGQTVEVLGFEFEAYRSDLQIERVDLLFVEQGSDEDKPWKVLEEVLIVDEDGDEVASVDASDKDNWEEESNDEYSIRFDDVEYVVEEGDEAKLYVAVTANDDLDSDDLGTWKVSFLDNTDGIRAVNAKGIDVYEGSAATKTFSLEEAEAGDLDITVYTEDNKDREVPVDEDEDTDEVVLYTAMAESKTGDNLIEEITVSLATTTNATTSPATGLSSIIKTLYIFVDGEEVGSESVADTATDNVTFDDLDIEIDEDDEVEITVVADINETDGNFANGDGVYVTGISVDYVDENDDDQTEADTTDGGDITFSVDALEVELLSAQDNPLATTNGTVGTFKIAVKVTAPENSDIYVPEFAATTTAKGATFAIYDGQGAEVVDGAGVGTTTVATISASNAKKSNGHFRIIEGNTATLTVNVQISNAGGTGDIARKIALESINYRVGADDADLQQYTAGIDSDFETDVVTISKEN